jgi:hypothetical protein
MADRAGAMHELLRSSHATGVEPWASMYASGHGEHWASATRYVAWRGETIAIATRGGVLLARPPGPSASASPATAG